MLEEKLTADTITVGLRTSFVGRNVLVYPELTSTMDVAREQAKLKAPEGTAVIAERQTAGRGRLRRAWHTPEGNIAVSIILYPPRQHLHSLIMLSSLAVLRAVRNVTGIAPQLKWPNDVLIAGKKVSGILIETQATETRVRYAVLGIGINVNMRLADHPDLRPIATSLAEKTGRAVSKILILRALFTEMEELYTGLRAGRPLFPEWRDNLATIGKRVVVTHGGDSQQGIAESVRDDGALLLRCPDGTLKPVTIGDVSLRQDRGPG